LKEYLSCWFDHAPLVSFCGWQTIAAGGTNGFSLTRSNRLYTYGDSLFNRLVLPSDVKAANDKQQIRRISATYSHTLALTAAGKVM
jgi:alpha-tubulin suppressor-like RCC1 family protein